MKKYLLSFLLMSAALPLFAGVVSVQEAQRKAETFWQSLVNTRSSGELTLAMTEQKTSATRADSPAFYVFTAGNNGYVIVSADDRTKEILGYSTENMFDVQNIPSNMKYWFSQYAAQISYEGNSYMQLTPGVCFPLRKTPTRAERAEVSPIVQTKWNQGAPYNEKCPVYSDGSQAVTGCVATALAQVMSVWKYPSALPAAEAYVNGATGETVDAIDAHTIDWSVIKNDYAYDEHDDNIAWLMRHCGQEVEMGYTPNGSGAVAFKCVKALMDFGYDESVLNIERFHYTSEGWENVIYNELADGRAVLYGGQTAGGEGHEFVCDGYKDGLFHINWGWGGMSDGYFVLSALDPDSQGIGGSDAGFDYDQEAIIGIAHGQGRVAEKYMISSDETLEDNIFDMFFWNLTGYTLDFAYGIGYIDADNNIHSLLRGSLQDFPTGYYIYSLNFDLAICDYPGPGTYKVVPISRESGKEKWHVACREDVYVTVVVGEDGSVTSSLSSAPEDPKDPNDPPKEFILEAEIVAVEGDFIVGTDVDIVFDLTNVGTKSKGVFILSLTDASGIYKQPFEVVLSPGTTGRYGVSYVAECEGTNIVAIENEAEEVLAQKEFEIKPVPVPAGSVTLNKTELSLYIGEIETLTATVSPENTTDKTVTWSTSDANVATVSAEGVVTAVAEGTATITAKCGDVTATCKVTVKTKVVAAESVTLNKTELSLFIGETEILTATVSPDNTTDKTVTWSSSEESVATVSAEGVVTAVKEGTATITAKCGEVSATCKVTVTAKVITAESVTLNKTELTLVEGDKETLTATVSPDNTTDKTVTWTSSDEGIATISAEGVVKAVKEGTATITAKCGEVSATCVVTVTKPEEPEPILVESIELNQTSYDLQPGETLQLEVTILPENATNKEVTWSSNNEEVVKVNETGLVTFVNYGDAVVTATAADGSGVTATCTFSNVNGIEMITVNGGNVDIYTLDGKKVQNTGKGIYIINGKKVRK